MTRTPDVPISSDEIRDALVRSGYLIETKVDRILRRRGFGVENNPTYKDPETGKSREYDLSANRVYSVEESGIVDAAHPPDYIFFRLIFECANYPQPVVFFPLRGREFSIREPVNFLGSPFAIYDGTGNATNVPNFIDAKKFHHYYSDKIATQYCSFRRVKESKQDIPPKWMASHPEEHWDSFRTLALIVRQEHQGVLSRLSLPLGRKIYWNFYYPVFVVSSDLYEASSRGSTVALKKTEWLQYQYREFIDDGEERTRIDVVTLRGLPRLLSAIQREGDEILRVARKHRKQLHDSVDRFNAERENRTRQRSSEIRARIAAQKGL